MGTFCDDLREVRAQRPMSLGAVSEVTKVPLRHLEALEEGRFAELPGGIFRKGILRGYLKALGADPEPWMPRFEQCPAELEVPAEPPVDLEQVAAGVERTRVTVPAAETGWSGVVLALMLLLAFGWCVWRYALRGRVMLSSATSVTVVGSAAPGRVSAR